MDDEPAPSVAESNGDTLHAETVMDADDADIAIVELNASPERAPRLRRAAPEAEAHPGPRRAAAKRAAPAPRHAPTSTGAAPARRRATAKRAAPAKRRSTAAGRPRPAAAIPPDTYQFRLVSRSELGRSGVSSVETPVGRLAVGIANGEPFAVSDTCRHLFASLGEGRVTRDGCLQCPWHRSRYDVRTGHMVRGPQGLLFLTVREIVRAYTNVLFPLHVYPVVERDGVIYLEAAGEDAGET